MSIASSLRMSFSSFVVVIGLGLGSFACRNSGTSGTGSAAGSSTTTGAVGTTRDSSMGTDAGMAIDAGVDDAGVGDAGVGDAGVGSDASLWLDAGAPTDAGAKR
jgi:hypothetical protein